MCNCCCSTECTNEKLKGEATTPEQPQSTPALESPIKEECVCSVVFRSIHIHDTGEFTEGEWSVEMNVNGVVKKWEKEGVLEDSYTINEEFRLPSSDTPIVIKVGGWEVDFGKAGGFFDLVVDNDDKLSDFIATYSAANIDPSIVRSYERRTSNATGDYTMYYEVVKVCKQIKTITTSSLTNDMKRYIGGKDKLFMVDKSESELIDWGLNKLHQNGWKVVGTMGDAFILEGFPPLLKGVKKLKRLKRG